MKQLNEEVIVLKCSSNTIGPVIAHNTFATLNKPKNENFRKFIIIGKTDPAIGIPVYAIGRVCNISEITSTSKSNIYFKNLTSSNWKFEYDLSDVIDLRNKKIYIKDIFLPKDISYIKPIEQFGYVSQLQYPFSLML